MRVICSSPPDLDKDRDDDLQMKTFMLQLMQICYLRLPMSEYHSKTGTVLNAYLGPGVSGSDKELTTALIKVAG